MLLMKASLLWTPLLLALPGTASAYADPGTGAFVYQAAYAAFLGGAYYLRKMLDRLWRQEKKPNRATSTPKVN